MLCLRHSGRCCIFAIYVQVLARYTLTLSLSLPTAPSLPPSFSLSISLPLGGMRFESLPASVLKHRWKMARTGESAAHHPPPEKK